VINPKINLGGVAGREKSWLLWGFAAATLLFLPIMVSLASAQTSGPIKLYKSTPTTNNKNDPKKPGIGKKQNSEDKIAIQELGGVDLSSVGAIGPAEGGFPADMWQGSDRRLLEILLPQLPVRPATATLRSLQRRLLLTAAAVPNGRAQGPSLLALRLEKLAEAGWLDEVVMLARQVPEGMTDATLARAQRDSLYLLGDVAGACQVVGQFSNLDPSLDWQKSAAFCAAITGDVATLDLTLALVQEQDSEDKVFFALINEIHHGEKTKIRRIKVEEPLDFALLRATNREFGAEITATSNPGMLRTIATWDNLPDEDQVKASVWAEAVGALPTAALRDRLMRHAFGDKARAAPDTFAAKRNAALAQALYFQIAADEEDPDDRARLLQKAFRYGRDKNIYADAVRLNQTTLNRIQPELTLKWFAEDAIRAHLLIGQIERAEAWFNLLSNDTASRVASRKMAPLMYLSSTGASRMSATATIGQWWLAETANSDNSRFQRAEYLSTLLVALGKNVPDSLWRALLSSPANHDSKVISGGLNHALTTAAGKKQLGKTVLLSLIALGETPPNNLAASNIAAIVSALEQVGLSDDARLLAIETLSELEF
jgi:hypothetical protein